MHYRYGKLIQGNSLGEPSSFESLPSIQLTRLQA